MRISPRIQGDPYVIHEAWIVTLLDSGREDISRDAQQRRL